jgi:hypothetical protein
MPFAVIADIHGNVAALEAVLADVKRRCSRRNSARQGDAATIGALTLSRMVMNKTLIALAALFASLISALRLEPATWKKLPRASARAG